ncbi:MAG: MoaD/ThiS family protein [Saprospiraceae bacterium]|nr:MoaD/ThiS family protein [Saprospiraceae bacterium]MCB9324194.1 MoaD/ThiS family protein [Lewinellaceae bacterium]
MKLKILTFGIARDIVEGKEIEVELREGANVADLKALLFNLYPEFERLASFAIAVNEAYRDDEYILSEGSEIVIVPPVSGG